MTRKDLQFEISLGEDSTRQFKGDVRNAESLAAEMAAFANSLGGRMLLGVTDDGSIAGLSPENVFEGLLPYHGLGSGIKRVLEQWPQIEFIDDHDDCLFVHGDREIVRKRCGRI